MGRRLLLVSQPMAYLLTNAVADGLCSLSSPAVWFVAVTLMSEVMMTGSRLHRHAVWLGTPLRHLFLLGRMTGRCGT